MERGKQSRCKILASNSFGRIKVFGGYVTSGFRREVGEDCTLLGCYSPSGGNLLSSFRDKLSVPLSGSKNPPKKSVTQILCIGAPDGRVRAVVSVVRCQLQLTA